MGKERASKEVSAATHWTSADGQGMWKQAVRTGQWLAFPLSLQ